MKPSEILIIIAGTLASAWLLPRVICCISRLLEKRPIVIKRPDLELYNELIETLFSFSNKLDAERERVELKLLQFDKKEVDELESLGFTKHPVVLRYKSLESRLSDVDRFIDASDRYSNKYKGFPFVSGEFFMIQMSTYYLAGGTLEMYIGKVDDKARENIRTANIQKEDIQAEGFDTVLPPFIFSNPKNMNGFYREFAPMYSCVGSKSHITDLDVIVIAQPVKDGYLIIHI